MQTPLSDEPADDSADDEDKDCADFTELLEDPWTFSDDESAELELDDCATFSEEDSASFSELELTDFSELELAEIFAELLNGFADS